MIWITGIGTATPLGNTYPEVADSLMQGRSAVRAVDSFDTTQQVSRIAGQCDKLPTPDGFDPVDFARIYSADQAALWCAVQALRDAGWWTTRRDVRVGIVLGLGAEWNYVWEADAHRGGDMVCTADSPDGGIADRLQTKLAVRGPCGTVAAACASGNIALGQARRWLEMGWVDVCIAGGIEMSVRPLCFAAFGNLGALSPHNDAPQTVSRPFDRGRNGFVLGEGGVLFVMEREETARRRGAKPHAELAGFGASSDASHLVIPSEDPLPAARAIRAALKDAQVDPSDVNYINAHATSTPVGDRFETKAIHEAFGPHSRSIPVSSTKSMTGHMLSAAAAFEALACIAAIERGAVPPTINLDDPDPECDLCHVPHQAREHRVDVAVNNSFGFGGSNTCVVLRRAA